jgi:hypothetical protein
MKAMLVAAMRRQRRMMKGEVRRRRMAEQQSLANTIVVPPSVAGNLKMEAMAVLAVIRDDAKATGRCTLPVARIAELAHVGRAKARAAIRLAESLGVVAIEHVPNGKRAIVNRGVEARC